MRVVSVPWFHILIAGLYVAIVFLSYFLAFKQLFFFLTLPWSYFITLLGWLLIHVLSEGMESIERMQIAGAFLNAILYLLVTIIDRKQE